MSVVLMYHALHPDSNVSEVDLEDQPYAVSESTFKEHIAVLKDYKVGLLSDDPSAEQPDVIVTFDDGHISNHAIALPLLESAGIPAYFFVTTDFIRSREFFCRPEHLKDFTTAGMVVGSHGVSHEFLADLPADAAKHELVHSRNVLQEWLDEDITTLSFPGGRYNKGTMAVAREAGYKQIFDSTFDTVSATDLAQNNALARVAIRRTTSLGDFENMVAYDKPFYRRVQRTQRIKQTVKKVLGNRVYHGLYKSISAH